MPYRKSHAHAADLPAQPFLSRYAAELAIAAGLLAATALLVRPAALRASLAVQGGSGPAAFQPAAVVGLVLLAVCGVALVLRLRSRLLAVPGLAAGACPACRGSLHRVHRHGVDRLLDLVLPVRRYRCADRQCRWQGLRLVPGRTARGRRRLFSPVVVLIIVSLLGLCVLLGLQIAGRSYVSTPQPADVGTLLVIVGAPA